jgi:phosphoglucomutase/phosphomannomutase
MKVVQVRDYLQSAVLSPGRPNQPLDGPVDNLVILDLAAQGNYVAVRPSGTEPKVKFYMFAFVPAEQLADLESTKEEVAQRMAAMRSDLSAYVKQE